VLALTGLVKKSSEETLFGLNQELSAAINELKKSVAEIPVHSACALFIHDVSRNWKTGEVIIIIYILI
jgi:hypothetical protein